MISRFVERYASVLKEYQYEYPWQVTDALEKIITEMIRTLGNDFNINNGVAIHRTATVEQNVILKAPAIVSKSVFLGANGYVRGPVFLDENVKVGAGCEIKQSIIFSDTAIAHFNYIGNSIIGSRVNFEAGSVAANHYNERQDKQINVLYNGNLIATGATKFGSLVGDDSKIGANAVLSPGTLLEPGSVVARLTLVQQVK